MTATHRLVAIVVVWAAFAWTSFFMFGLSVTLFLPPFVVALLSIVFVVAALVATLLIMSFSQSEP
jgi:hypothetical protein